MVAMMYKIVGGARQQEDVLSGFGGTNVASGAPRDVGCSRVRIRSGWQGVCAGSDISGRLR